MHGNTDVDFAAYKIANYCFQINQLLLLERLKKIFSSDRMLRKKSKNKKKHTQWALCNEFVLNVFASINQN